jgi:hypothetical protein
LKKLSPFGKDGVEFQDHFLEDHSELLSEGVIHLPGHFTKSERSSLGQNNPVAFVTENKRLLFHLLDILVGLKPEGAGYFAKSQGSSSRRTLYYKESIEKGLFGVALSFLGVTEAHKRGHLHFHFTVNAGISAYAMQQFANLPELHAKMTDTLNRVFKSELN